MSKYQKALILLVCLLLSGAVHADTCPYQVCLCTGSDIVCTNKGLTSVPPLTTKENRYSPSLHLENNEITTISSGSFPANLTDIFLENNPISIIDDLAFDNTGPTLQTLSFSNVQFTRVPDALLRITSLRTFSLSDSNIHDWNENAMAHIGQTATTLYLDNVGLTQWPSWMSYFTRLSDLTISSSAISNISDDGLTSFASTLESLSLNGNSLTSVPKALTKLTVLQMLYLHDNQITDIQWLPHLASLYSLYLQDNQVADAGTLSQALQTFASTLTDLQIHHNALKEIPDMSFLHSVTSLDLSYNQISDDVSGSLPPELFDLNLEDNNLPSFPSYISTLISVTDFIANTNSFSILEGTAFPPGTIRTELAYNRISKLTENSFPEHSKIQNLNVNDNPISTITNLAFENLPDLTVLYLRRTRLVRLPLAMVSLTKLTYFDISGSREVVCTCLEKSLRSVILLMQRENVKGNCGLTSIYHFYVNLSPSCP